jgi:hypothetical protein
MRISRPLIVVSMLCISACKRSPPRPSVTTAAPSPAENLPAVAPAVRWDKAKLVVEGWPALTFEVKYGVEGDVSFGVFGQATWPKASKVVLGTSEAWLTNSGTASITKPYGIYGSLPLFHPKAGAGPLDMIPPSNVPFKPSAPVIIRLSNGVEMSITLPEGQVLESLEAKIMKEAAKGPFRFDGEKEHSGPHTTYFVHTRESEAVVGPGATLADADWIASGASETAKVEGKMCAYNMGGKYPLEVETQTVTIFERRTHAIIETKVWKPASVGCPTFAIGGRAILGSGRDVVFAWRRSVAKAHGG